MPIHNVQCPNTEGVPAKEILIHQGARLLAEISIPSIVANTLLKERQKIPSPLVAPVLLDTGATKTCVDEDILKALGLPAVGRAAVSTPSGKSTLLLYPVKLEFPGTPLRPLEFSSVIGASLKEQGIGVLIGRDILSDCILIWNGPAGHFSISF